MLRIVLRLVANKHTMNSTQPSEDEKPTKGLFGNAVDADEALRAFEGLGGERIELDDATRKRLLRRIDLYMMPVQQYRSPLKDHIVHTKPTRYSASSTV